jgi:hypothetical protein
MSGKASEPTGTITANMQKQLLTGIRRDITLMDVLTAAEVRRMYPSIKKTTFYQMIRRIRHRNTGKGAAILIHLSDVLETFGEPEVLIQTSITQPRRKRERI